MQVKGKAIKLGDSINTDFIISGRYKFSITDIKELSKHIMEDIDPDFPAKISPGESIIAAGRNFGLGSSREQAPLVIQKAGIVAVVAKSFARIFYRNSFNIGLLLVESDTDKIKEGDRLEIDLEGASLRNITRDTQVKIDPLPKAMKELLRQGGAVNYFRKHKRLPDV
jgi:3-isopropylmalate/(R)-2-methylmalate dehydratase small subunit